MLEKEEKLKDNKIYNTALYCRLSLDDGSVGESGSIQTQKIILEEYAKMHGFKIYDGGEKGMQVLCPGHKSGDKFYEDFHPVSKEAREALNGYILDAYEQKLEQTQEEGQSEDENLDEDEEHAFEQTM